jgi:hypothetical protein
MRLCFALLVVLVASRVSAQGTGTVAGRVLDRDGVTALIGVNVRLDGTTLGAATDIDGNYRIIGVPVGAYSVTASYIGYLSQTQASVDVNAGHTRQLDLTLSVDPDTEYIVLCCFCELPLISADPYASRVLVGEDIERMALNR